jgi:CubicO group peptidase (beta-lactamase class C family)
MSYKTGSICMKVISVAFFLLFLQPVNAQYNWGDLDAQLEAKQKILGNDFVVMLWKGDTLVYKKERGTFNSKTQAPIASCSKWLTAALVMQFVDEGKISLDDKVSKYIPELNKYFKGYITFRDCLSHMTGIKDEGSFLKKIIQQKKFNTLEEEVNSYAARDIRANTGTDFWYGSIGLNMAGRALEVMTKRKFDVLIRTKLLIPLGMRKTTFTNLEGGPVNPSGGAQSTADDYMKFLVMLLNKGKYNGVQLLSENAVNEMIKIRTNPSIIKYAPRAAQGFNYASGAWVVEEKDGKATVLASPGLFGTWPMVDYCRGYTYLVFCKNLLGEEKADAYMQLKEVIDEQLKSTCQ